MFITSLLFACNPIHVIPPPSVVQQVQPNDAPIAPQESSKANVESMNTEYYLGSQTEEIEQLQEFALQIQQIQNTQHNNTNQPVQRGFHGKAHGCLQGEMRVIEDRDPRSRYGIFADEYSSWPVWVRFSNGVGWEQHDKKLDARGMAIKVMGVQGERLLPDETATQDFLLTNSPTPVGKNAEEFMKFAHKNTKGNAAVITYALTKPSTVAPAAFATQPVDSMISTQYWSGSAYHLGAHQAVKWTTKSCTEYTEKPSKKDPNYLQKDLEEASRDGLCFRLYAQFQVDPAKTPIENAAKVWEIKDSPEIPVAEIILPAQDFLTPERMRQCQSFSFNPWHGIPAHQPMGHINRARKYVYDASRNHRGGSVEPLVESPTPEVPTESVEPLLETTPEYPTE